MRVKARLPAPGWRNRLQDRDRPAVLWAGLPRLRRHDATSVFQSTPRSKASADRTHRDTADRAGGLADELARAAPHSRLCLNRPASIIDKPIRSRGPSPGPLAFGGDSLGSIGFE